MELSLLSAIEVIFGSDLLLEGLRSGMFNGVRKAIVGLVCNDSVKGLCIVTNLLCDECWSAR